MAGVRFLKPRAPMSSPSTIAPLTLYWLMDGAASSRRFHPRASLGSMNCEVVTCNGEPHIGRFSYSPVTEELSIRAQLLEEGGPAMWNQFMSELAHAHHGH